MKCDTCTALGSPLVPEVKISMTVSSGSASRCGANSPAAARQVAPTPRRSVEHPDARRGRRRQQRPVLGVGHHDLAVGLADVGGQCVAAAGGVEPAEHISAEACGGHLVQELGGVAQQHADVHRPVAVGERQQRGGPGRPVAQVLAPGPALVAVLHAQRRRTSRVREAIAGWFRSAILLVLAKVSEVSMRIIDADGHVAEGAVAGGRSDAALAPTHHAARRRPRSGHRGP